MVIRAREHLPRILGSILLKFNHNLMGDDSWSLAKCGPSDESRRDDLLVHDHISWMKDRDSLCYVLYDMFRISFWRLFYRYR